MPTTTPSELLKAWFEASDAESLARAEVAILAASAGPMLASVAVHIAPGDVVRAPPSDRDPIALEHQWLAKAHLYEGGPRCTALFGALGEAARGERLAHVAFDFELRHPNVDAPMRLVPVPPPAMRPPSFADGVLGAPALDAHLCAIARWAQAIGRAPNVAELPPYVFEPLLASIRAVLAGGTALACERWIRSEDVPVIPPSGAAPPYPDELRLSLASMALDGDRLAIDNGQIAVVDLPTGGLTRFDSRGAQLEAIVGPHLLFTAMSELATDDEGTLLALRHHALDMRDRTWVPWPDEVPRVSFEEAQERTYLARDDGASAQLHEVADYPVTNELTPDRRFGWAEDKEGSGGVFRTRDASYVMSFQQSFDDELENGTPYLDGPWGEFRPWEGSGEDDDDVDDVDEGNDPLRAPNDVGASVAAIAVRDDVVLTYRHGIVARNGKPWFALALPIDVAAFDAKGERLAVHLAAHSFGEPALLVFDLRGDAPAIAYHRPLRG